MKKVYWTGALKDECQACHRSFGVMMYDCAMPGSGGVWGNICRVCFSHNGCRLGTGLGQEYALTKDKRWEKVRG